MTDTTQYDEYTDYQMAADPEMSYYPEMDYYYSGGPSYLSEKRDGWKLAFLLIVVILGPKTAPGANLPPIRLSDFVILFMLFTRGIKAKRLYGGFIFSPRVRVYSVFMMVITFLILSSTLMNTAMGRYPFFIKDYFISLGFIRGMCIAAVTSTFHLEEKQVRQFVKGVIVVTAMAAALSIVQKSKPYLVSGIIEKYYAVEYSRLDIATSGTQNRVVGTLGNANIWGATLVLLGSVSISAFMYIKGLVKFAALAVYLFMGMAVLICTGSRTSVIALVAVSGCAVVLALKGKAKIWLLLIGISFVIVGAWVRANADSLPINPRMVAFIKGEQTVGEGLTDRHAVWQRSLDAVKDRLIFGEGASRTIYQLSDNGYIMMLLRTGIVGLSVYLCMLAVLSISGLKTLFAVTESHQRALILMPLMVLVTHLLFEMVADFLFSIEYMGVLSFFMGILCAMSRERIERGHHQTEYYEGVEAGY